MAKLMKYSTSYSIVTPLPYCNNRAVYTRENKPRITQSAAYASRELSHLYDNSLYKKLVRGLCKPRMSILSRLYEQFAAYFPSYKPPYCRDTM